jgi:hypothetical protein
MASDYEHGRASAPSRDYEVKFEDKLKRFAAAMLKHPKYGVIGECDKELYSCTRIVHEEFSFTPKQLQESGDPEGMYLSFKMPMANARFFSDGGDERSVIDSQLSDALAVPRAPIVLTQVDCVGTNNDSFCDWGASAQFVPMAKYVSRFGDPMTIVIPRGGRCDSLATLHVLEPHPSDMLKQIIARNPLVVHMSPGIVNNFVYYGGERAYIPRIVFQPFFDALFVPRSEILKTKTSEGGFDLMVMPRHDAELFLREVKAVISRINKSTMEFSTSTLNEQARSAFLAEIDPEWKANSFAKDFATRITIIPPPDTNRAANFRAKEVIADMVATRVAGAAAGSSDAEQLAMNAKVCVSATFKVEYLCPCDGKQ